MKPHRIFLLLPGLLMISFSAIAQDVTTEIDVALEQPIEEKLPWNQRHAEGWFYRDLDPESEDELDEELEEPTLIDPSLLYPPIDKPLLDPLKALEAMQKAVETSKARMVVQPTPKNILNYIKVQNELLEKNTVLADHWQRLIWQNPEYDYNQVRPSNPVALLNYNKEFKQSRRDAMHEIAKEYGLYFVIAEGCRYCHAMAPYLKRFAERFGFHVVAVSTDGGSVPEYPDPMYSPEFAEKLGVKTTPAIILAKPNVGIIEPIAYGFISLQELERRIYRLFRLPAGQPNFRVSNTGG